MSGLFPAVYPGNLSFATLCFCRLTEFIVQRKREILRRETGDPKPQIPFDYAQGRLSTPMGAKNAPVSAQDDRHCLTNLKLRTLYLWQKIASHPF
jgi:hypothetical protein